MYPESRQHEPLPRWSALGERVDTVFNYQPYSLPQSPYDNCTSSGFTDSAPWFPLVFPDPPMTGERDHIVNPTLTLSEPLPRDCGAVTSPVSTAICQTPGAPQAFQDYSTFPPSEINGTTFDHPTPVAPQAFQGYSTFPPSEINGTTFDHPTPGAPQAFQDYSTFPPSEINGTTFDHPTPGAPQAFQDYSTFPLSKINGTTFDQPTPGAPQVGYIFSAPSQTELPAWKSQISSAAQPATITPGNPKQCPACQVVFPRRQERDRHLLSYLPHWIHCPLPHCPWRGNRVKAFERHWQQRDHHEYHKSYGRIPGRGQFEIFDPQEFVNQIKAGTVPVCVAAYYALERVHAKADQLHKQSMSSNQWGYKSKRLPLECMCSTLQCRRLRN